MVGKWKMYGGRCVIGRWKGWKVEGLKGSKVEGLCQRHPSGRKFWG